ncbi:CAP domain-containing protein [Aneurinibacillus terranovensis]|uniref:CAP domain-containing protein n=1 Tax=Aneurinibacillus terranovensis TaxID=278991 RepID=UPI000402B90B|nr:CAP domain-containing protein [Aneurinibacillus terranovensis]
MKKILAATILCTSFLGVNVATTKAAECPAQLSFSGNSQVYSLNSTQIQNLMNQYFGYGFQRFQSQPAPARTVTPVPAKVYTPQTSAASAPAPSKATSSQNAPLTQDEQQMLNLVNQERQKQGLAPLKINMQLEKMARVKAKDMIDNNYFSHQSPTYGSPFDMMKRFGVSYRTAGENIAGNSSVQAAHQALMNSAGHRANILNGSFTQVGIGIVNGGPYGKMFVQDFVG